jgi:hypothetical protein
MFVTTFVGGMSFELDDRFASTCRLSKLKGHRNDGC